MFSSASGTTNTRETNPLLPPLVDHPGAYIAVKAATTGVFIWTAEKLRKKHPWR